MKSINVISPFEKKLKSSGSAPIVFMCDDINYYACKYGKPNDLFNEYLGASFCKIWEIPVPDFSFVNVEQEYVPSGIPKANFAYPCFGSFYLEHAMDVNDFLHTWEGNYYEIDKIFNKVDLLKIGLFDLWLSNEDRNHNNANLLINPTIDGYQLVAIDHVTIFNTSTLNHGLVQLSENESILNTKLCNILIKRGAKLNQTLLELEENFYLCVKECSKKFAKILNEVPNEWNIDIVEREKLIRKNLFDDTWTNQTVSHFRTILESSLDKI